MLGEPMFNWEDRVRNAVRQLTTQRDDAWHTLVEIGPVGLPFVLETYKRTTDYERKLALLSVIAEYRTRNALQFLADAIASGNQEIWKLALDALVMLGGDASRGVLMDVLATADATKREWIAEALEQIGPIRHDPQRGA